MCKKWNSHDVNFFSWREYFLLQRSQLFCWKISDFWGALYWKNVTECAWSLKVMNTWYNLGIRTRSFKKCLWIFRNLENSMNVKTRCFLGHIFLKFCKMLFDHKQSDSFDDLHSELGKNDNIFCQKSYETMLILFWNYQIKTKLNYSWHSSKYFSVLVDVMSKYVQWGYLSRDTPY